MAQALPIDGQQELDRFAHSDHKLFRRNYTIYE